MGVYYRVEKLAAMAWFVRLIESSQNISDFRQYFEFGRLINMETLSFSWKKKKKKGSSHETVPEFL